ncbi:MAG: TIGR03435 family protein [Acidobacteriia bacterium]|nr:TIGR03435 family protein [Terriglobia bacterium]
MTRCILAAILLMGCSLHAQAPPKFEVASAKPYKEQNGGPRNLFSYGPQGINFGGLSLAFIIGEAYTFPVGRIIGPGSLTKEALWAPLAQGYDIVAKADQAVSKPQLRLMLQSLLADRFKLAFHWETKTGPVYRLVVATGGPKFDAGDAAGGYSVSVTPDGFTFRNLEMIRLVGILSGRLDRVVVDQTGLQGLYNFVLKMPSPAGQDLAAVKRQDRLSPETLSAPDFAEALKQLGLQLFPDKAPVDYLVVDSVERSSEN